MSLLLQVKLQLLWPLLQPSHQGACTVSCLLAQQQT
jgi:hypothetical protein